jgi:hypothetical protein
MHKIVMDSGIRQNIVELLEQSKISIFLGGIRETGLQVLDKLDSLPMSWRIARYAPENADQDKVRPENCQGSGKKNEILNAKPLVGFFSCRIGRLRRWRTLISFPVAFHLSGRPFNARALKTGIQGDSNALDSRVISGLPR